MKIINKYYDLNKINKKIVLISDIHYYSKKELNHLYKVANEINNIKPDYVCIAGDITDHSYVEDEELFVSWLKELSNNNKVILTIGNHEYYSNKKKTKLSLNNAFLTEIKKIKNLYFLKNENITIDDVNFIGLDLGIDYYKNKNILNIDVDKLIDDKKYNVLICHSPDDAEDIVRDKNIDLVLCGHTHGGIVPRFLRPIFKNRGIISPSKKLFPKYAYGLKLIKKTCVITTSGIRVISHTNPFYLFTNLFSSEIVIISI